MSGQDLVARQRLMAQAVFALAHQIENSTGYALTPVAFNNLPAGAAGMIASISDSTVNSWGATIAIGGGPFTVLAWYNGSAWKVIGA
jgi:hypothetical protein